MDGIPNSGSVPIPALFLEAVCAAGSTARLNGLPLKFNPYKCDTQPQLHQAWAAGWQQAASGTNPVPLTRGNST